MRKYKQLILIGCFFFLCSCSQSKDLEISGSTSVAPLMNKLVEQYQKDTNQKININADGSSAGIKAASENLANIGMVSREVEKDELALGLKSEVIAIDAMAVIVNKDNQVTNLSQQELCDIYSGKIKNWSEVGGKNLGIVIVSREYGSGTRNAFEEITGLLNEDKSSNTNAKAIIVNSTGAVIENVQQKEGAIGYLSLGSITENTKTISINNIEPTKRNVLRNKYLLTRNFNIVTKNADDKTKAFIEFIHSEKGHEIIAEEGFINVSQD
ncbi:phosphate ABC transporter substrate-binding protein [Erysipelotrichaceae bacterium OttesenSCG-928-M19]|nr:phosphate ABC transporter substrate-binding protein [Erysipelotrichaceae bacterium OttesenSCG-928-M19]